jgi:hypothetical protein
MALKFSFYERYGVEEYYIYDPDEFTLEGWLRHNDQLVAIPDMTDWTSPRLGIRMLWQPRQELQLFYPNGESFLTSLELKAQVSQAVQRAEQERKRAEQAEMALAAERERLAALEVEIAKLRASKP